MVNLYYPSDQDVQEDLELQAWITDIYMQGFAELPRFGQSLYYNLNGSTVKCFKIDFWLNTIICSFL